ncbi:hypothetical protein L1987_39374 [Smallanthus sonchifolius]|uniref:Uncharacterized protein n=1 Tax=Smallanthus sonchifolius TaxID=185202 RepID=A0ACB9HLV4_9ASTR|nr:hypothetical protein L1987_39374 [Smallanthus sonchifolius]
MASPTSKPHQLCSFADLALSEMTNASQPLVTSISTRVPEKDQKQVVRIGPDPCSEGGQSSRKRFSVSLTKEDVKKDLFAITGKPLIRCNKRRNKKMKNDLEALIPGGSLDGHAPETLQKSYGPFSSKRY